MKFLDLLRLITGNLSRRKARVALTAIGVVIGTAAVVILVSLAIGLQKSATDQLYGIGDLTQIDVMPTYGGGGGFGGPIFVGSPLKNQLCLRIRLSTRYGPFLVLKLSSLETTCMRAPCFAISGLRRVWGLSGSQPTIFQI